MEKDESANEEKQAPRINKAPTTARSFVFNRKTVLFAAIPLAVLIVMVVLLITPIGQHFLLTSGIPLPSISIEKIEFQHGDKIVVYIRNTGPTETKIAQADIDDRIHPAAIEPARVLSRLGTARVVIPFPWNAGEPYEVGITTSDGVRFHKSIEAAAPAPIPNISQASLFALIGTYVGVIPILIGLWYPFVKGMRRIDFNFFLSLTVGLLVFLGIDTVLEGNKTATSNVASVFNGQILIVMITIISFLILVFISEKLNQRASKIPKQ